MQIMITYTNFLGSVTFNITNWVAHKYVINNLTYLFNVHDVAHLAWKCHQI